MHIYAECVNYGHELLYDFVNRKFTPKLHLRILRTIPSFRSNRNGNRSYVINGFSFFGISSFHLGRANLDSLLKLQINGKNAERESISPIPIEIKERKLNYRLCIFRYWSMNAW